MRSLEQIMRYALRPCAIALCLTALGNQVTVAAPTSEIQSLTVAFLYNFMKLSEWPSGTDTQELTLCAVQAGDYSIDVDSLAGKNVQDYSLKIKHLVPGDSPSGCQLLFISDDEKPIRVQEWLKNIENSPVLTVSGVPGFLDQGGMIALVSEGDHLQFEVNLELVDKVGIKLSSKMLQIARSVRGY